MRISILVILVIGLVATSGCKDTKSKVESVTPVDGATVESIPTTISVGFDREMDRTTLNNGNFTVEGSETGSIDGVISYDAMQKIAVFTIADALQPGETITVRLNDKIRSDSNKFLREFSSSFQIKAPEIIVPDPFELISTSPAIESTNIERSSTLTAKFSAGYNPFSPTASTVHIRGERSGKRTVQFANLFTGGQELQINVDRPFLPGERVLLTLTDALSSQAGARLTSQQHAFVVKSSPALEALNNIEFGNASTSSLLFAVDANRDGEDEWCLLRMDGTLIVGDYDGKQGSTLAQRTLGTPLLSAAMGDFNADGRMDLVALTGAGDELLIMLGDDSAEVFGPTQSLAFGGGLARELISADFNYDGTDDLLLIAEQSSQGVRVRLGEENNFFQEQLSHPNVQPLSSVISGDWNGDGLQDLAYANGDRELTIAWQDLAGEYRLTEGLATTADIQGFLSANFDGGNSAQLVVLAGSKESATLFDFDQTDSPTGQSLAVGAASRGSIAVDHDGDGALDLISPVAGQSLLWISHGDGQGNFSTSPTPISAPGVAEKLVCGDFDADRAIDIAMVGASNYWINLSGTSQPVVNDTITITDVSGAPGDNVNFMVLADNESSLDGFTVVMSFDPSQLQLDSLLTAGTDAGAVGVEFEIPQIDNNTGIAIVAALFDFLPPMDGGQLLPGEASSILTGQLTISISATVGQSMLRLQNELGTPPTDNLFVSGGLSIYPTLNSGTLTIGGTPTPPVEPSFLRGDANSDGTLDIADGSMLSAYLFQGGATPACLAAADANDDGTVDNADPVVIYQYLMSGGPPPAAPFPIAGSDPTPDLGCGS